MRAGCTLFPVSTRNAAVAVADMFKRTATGHMIVSSDAVLREAAKDALEELAKVEHSVIQLDLPTFEDLFTENLDATSPLEAVVELPTTFDMNTLASIMHSSGMVARAWHLPGARQLMTLRRFHRPPKDHWLDSQDDGQMGKASS